MTTIQVGSTSVPVPSSLDLELPSTESTAVEVLDAQVTEYPVEARRQAFLVLFPDAHDPSKVVPLEGMDVYLLDANRSSQFVHVGRYHREGDHFESDGGWFERVEVELWSYVPNTENELLRNIGG